MDATPISMTSALNVIAELPHILVSLLSERFALAAHSEMRQDPGFELLVANGGPKIAEVGFKALVQRGTKAIEFRFRL